MQVKIMFGNHAAIKGEKLLFVEKIVENLSIIINMAAVTNPIARWAPLPPRTLRLATTAPIMVSIKTENGVANLLYSSTCNVFNPSVPLNSWSCMY